MKSCGEPSLTMVGWTTNALDASLAAPPPVMEQSAMEPRSLPRPPELTISRVSQLSPGSWLGAPGCESRLVWMAW